MTTAQTKIESAIKATGAFDCIATAYDVVAKFNKRQDAEDCAKMMMDSRAFNRVSCEADLFNKCKLFIYVVYIF